MAFPHISYNIYITPSFKLEFCMLLSGSVIIFLTLYIGLQNLYTIVKYCLNKVHCRRSLIALSFEEQWKPEDCNNNCDVCQKFCSSSTSSGTLESGSNMDFATIDDDISTQCRFLIEIIEQTQEKQQWLTALKLIDMWRKKTSVSASLLGETACGSSTRLENILLHAFLEGVLKEEFHFTPFSTISYIGLGRKANPLKKGIIRVMMKRVESVSAPKSSGHKSSTCAPEQADDKGPQGDGNVAAVGSSLRKRMLPKMILDGPTDDNNYNPCTKKRKLKLQQSDKPTDSRQIEERTLAACKQAGKIVKMAVDSSPVIIID